MRIKIVDKEPRKIRYLKQRDNCNCAPIAILNILKWCGYNATKKYLKDLKRYCKTTKSGTKSKNVTSAFKRYKKIRIKFVNKINLKILDKYLDSKYVAMILQSKWSKDYPERHYFVVTEKKEKYGRIYYKVINWGPENKVEYLTRTKMVKVLNRSLRSNKDPKGWLVKRKDK